MRELEALVRAVDAVQLADDSALPDAVLCDQVMAFRRQIDRLESMFTSQVGVMHERGAASAEGYISTAAYLRHACKMTAGAAEGPPRHSGTVDRLATSRHGIRRRRDFLPACRDGDGDVSRAPRSYCR